MAKNEKVTETNVEVSPAVQEVNELVAKGVIALEEFKQLNQEQVD